MIWLLCIPLLFDEDASAGQLCKSIKLQIGDYGCHDQRDKALSYWVNQIYLNTGHFYHRTCIKSSRIRFSWLSVMQKQFAIICEPNGNKVLTRMIISTAENNHELQIRILKVFCISHYMHRTRQTSQLIIWGHNYILQNSRTNILNYLQYFVSAYLSNFSCVSVK